MVKEHRVAVPSFYLGKDFVCIDDEYSVDLNRRGKKFEQFIRFDALKCFGILQK